MDNVLFKIGTKASYEALATKSDSTLYWLTDTHELYKGATLFGTGSEATSTLAGLMSAADKAKLDTLSEGSGGSGSVIEYEIEKQETPNAGCAATYKLKKTVDGVSTYVGDDINLMENAVLQGGSVGIVTTADQPYDGAQVGDYYIDLILNDADGTHIYIPATEMIEEYTAGNGIVINDHVISLEIDEMNANGLAVGSSGLYLSAATESSAGAMTAADKTALSTAVTDIADIKSSITWGTF